MLDRKELTFDQLDKIAGGTSEATLAKFNTLIQTVAAKFDAWLVDINATTASERITRVTLFINEVLDTYDEEIRNELLAFMQENDVMVKAIIAEIARTN